MSSAYITVNGREQKIVTGVVSYSLIVELAAGEPTERDYSVTFRRGPPDRREGTLSRGDVIDVVDGMVFNAVVTGVA